MLRDLSNKQKLVLLIVLIVCAGPTWALSGPGMKFWLEKAQANDGRDPKAPERIWKIIWIYDVTYRTEEAKQLCHDFILRYGGDQTELPLAERYITWEELPWNDENPRPAYYEKKPHPLTGKVLCLWAEYFEKERNYPASKQLFTQVVKYFQSDPEAVKRAEAGLIRDRTRSF